MKMQVKKLVRLAGLALAIASFAPSARAALLTYELRAPGGGKSVVLSGNGDTVTLDLFAVIQNGNADSSDDGVLSIAGSFKSSIGGNLGNLSPLATVAPFNGTGAATGTAADLDADGDLDVGATSPTSATGYWAGVSNATPSPILNQPVGGFLVGRVLFTITDALIGSTEVNFVPRVKTNNPTATQRFSSDGAAFVLAGSDIEVAVGAPVQILVPEPATLGLGVLGLTGFLARRRRA